MRVARVASWLLVILMLHLGAPAVLADRDLSEVARGQTGAPLVALTFDAGGVAGPAERIIALLRDRGLRVTFFLSGRWVEAYPELVAQLGADGHELANHSYSHPNLRTLSSERIRWELQHTDQLIAAATGQDPARLYRPPFGARDRRVLSLTEGLGYRSVMWALDSGDWRAEATPAGVARRVLTNAAPGDIVVMHVAAQATAAALPVILDGLAERGLQVVTVSEVLVGAMDSRADQP
jgi:peptidoglycan/xylan/chitin deacetylase (PgdA/CDA1 family)